MSSKMTKQKCPLSENGKVSAMVWCQHLIKRLVRNDILWLAASLLVWFLFLNLTFYNYNLQHIWTASSSNLPYDHGILQCDMTLQTMKMSSFKVLETIQLIFKSNFQQKLPRKKSSAQTGILVTIAMKNLRNWSNSCQLQLRYGEQQMTQRKYSWREVLANALVVTVCFCLHVISLALISALMKSVRSCDWGVWPQEVLDSTEEEAGLSRMWKWRQGLNCIFPGSF